MTRAGKALLAAMVASAVVSSSAEAQIAPGSNINVTAPTGGGKQFWTDRMVQHDWRIQQNVCTGHCRLLDDKDFRRAWGSYDGCRQEFERLRAKQGLSAVGGRVVVTVHGLGRSRQSMAGLGKYLAKEGGYTWINVSYASTRDTIDAHGRALAEIVGQLTEADEVSFVGHSLGNLVIRRWLAYRAEADPQEQGPPLGRIVMLAPPNQGAQIAEQFHNSELFQLVYGLSGSQLSRGWDEIERRLAIPPCPFGIIAGGRGEDGANNPLLAGDDDFVVTVEEARLAGAADFLVVPTLHTFFMDDKHVRECTLRFLQHGYFVSEQDRRTIPAIEPPR
ncbi:MAG: lipase [Planctomycetaceae bacterium]|nr:lipase [Planctomycetaceae bacterium]